MKCENAWNGAAALGNERVDSQMLGRTPGRQGREEGDRGRDCVCINPTQSSFQFTHRDLTEDKE